MVRCFKSQPAGRWACLPTHPAITRLICLPDGGRRAFIERVYTSLNAAGAALPSDKFDAVVNESALVRTANLPQFHAVTRSSHPPPFFFLCAFFFFLGLERRTFAFLFMLTIACCILIIRQRYSSSMPTSTVKNP